MSVFYEILLPRLSEFALSNIRICRIWSVGSGAVPGSGTGRGVHLIMYET